MKAYLLKGSESEIRKIMQENRIRVGRGLIEFAPCQPESALDSDSIATLREDLEAKTTACMEMAASQVELASIIRELVAVTAEGGIVIPGDLADRLAKFGVNVPKMAEIVPDTVEIADNDSDSVSEVVSNEPETVEDNKAVEVEDMTEVDIDDVKDIEESDVKEAPAPTPKKTRRSKKQS